MFHKELTTVDITGLEGDGSTRCFEYTDPFGNRAHGFLVRHEGVLRAYRNLCPHWAVALDHDGRFFDEEGEELMCHMHGATFDPATGACTFGPPEGASLERFELEEVAGAPHLRRVLRTGGIAL